jgi:hypothetical protein
VGVVRSNNTHLGEGSPSTEKGTPEQRPFFLLQLTILIRIEGKCREQSERSKKEKERRRTNNNTWAGCFRRGRQRGGKV